VVPPVHTLPQAPQLFESFVGSTQDVPHTIVPLAQPPEPPVDAHAPSWHVSPVGQTLPQAPQLLLSMAVLVHVWSGAGIPSTTLFSTHTLSSGGHVQVPYSHTAPMAHTPPQVPQLSASAVRSMQVVPQSVSPVGQTHAPF
jgi:hypothetical protein